MSLCCLQYKQSKCLRLTDFQRGVGMKRRTILAWAILVFMLLAGRVFAELTEGLIASE